MFGVTVGQLRHAAVGDSGKPPQFCRLVVEHLGHFKSTFTIVRQGECQVVAMFHS